MDLLETNLQPAIKANGARDVLVLEVVHPRSLEQILDQFPLLLGRDQSCDVVLQAELVSRQHAELSSRGGELVLRDLNSRNGCHVNGVAVKGEQELEAGDLIRLGGALMLLTSRPIDQLEAEDPDPQSPLIGGRSLARVRQHINLLAPTPLRIMILGDSGTGKELVARELHRLSGCSGPFIAINCAALPESLVETELFGHTRGAFSGAVRDKPGLFEAAQDGTLFLDEVAELPLASQAKLLRVVETGELRRVGALQSIHTSCRILCATNHNLEQDVERRLFRGDLAARLSEAEIQLPPLRDRVADIPLLAGYLGRRGGGKIQFSAQALESMASYGWPLNVRELDNTVRMLEVIARGELVTPEMLPDNLRLHRAGHWAPSPAENQLITTLKKNSGNIRRTSQELGVSRTYIYRQLDRCGIDPITLRSGAAMA